MAARKRSTGKQKAPAKSTYSGAAKTSARKKKSTRNIKLVHAKSGRSSGR